ncbi:MAG: hypothetical protein HY821_03710 [Acidobacteria bacterium]|nr:hypothetical protein [Acidobacteriota bacterium]
MTRRSILSLLPAGALAARAEQGERLRGRLRSAGAELIFEGPNGPVALSGDADSLRVMRDPRLRNDEFELNGHTPAAGRFSIDPIHTRAIFVWRKGRRLVVTYWCAVCAIRAWTPGKCQCCQEEMDLDPRDPSLKETDPSD